MSPILTGDQHIFVCRDVIRCLTAQDQGFKFSPDTAVDVEDSK